MQPALPDNAAMLAFARDVSWQQIEETREQFLEYLNSIRSKRGSHPVSANMIRHLSQGYFEEDAEAPDGNVLLSKTGHPFILGTILGRRFQQGPWLDYVKPYNLNPAVIHTNIHEAGGMLAVRPVGVELEVGMIALDGSNPTDIELDRFQQAYVTHAQRIGATLDISPELCIYQAEVTMPPVYGYARLLRGIELNMATLAHAAHEAGLLLQIMSVYASETDFATSQSNKVETIAIFLNEINETRAGQRQIADEVRKRYHISRGDARPANLLRFQGYHMHVDIAGRSEALGLLGYQMNLGSASAIANAALLKGGPFMDGACDPELLCVREHVRAISITGHYVGLPLSPHLQPDALERHAYLLRANLANGTARALLYGEEENQPYSGMHNMLGRVRPDLETSKRVCTLESTGMPSNPCAERLAAVATDYQLSQLVIEHYFRRHGTHLEALYADNDFIDVFAPLHRDAFHRNIHASDLHCTDMTLETPSGAQLSLVDFYEKKRRLLKRLLSPLNVLDTRDVDGLYDRIYHFLVAPNGGAQTIDDYLNHPTRRGTGNWGRILLNAYLEAGGVRGSKHPEAVHTVIKQLHQALLRRYEVL
ncbi:MAG: hypothetical protein OHK0023_06400 [Anaerolineae bacterium]